MKTLEIVEGLNRYFESVYPNKGHFVSKLNIQNSKIVKALKIYTLELWHIDKDSKDLFITCELIKKYSEDDAPIIHELNIEFTELILNNLDKIKEKYGV